VVLVYSYKEVNISFSFYRWVCTHCSLMSCNRSSLQKHSTKIHEKDRKPEAIAPLTPNKDIEEWVCLTLYCNLCPSFVWSRSTWFCPVASPHVLASHQINCSFHLCFSILDQPLHLGPEILLLWLSLSLQK